VGVSRDGPNFFEYPLLSQERVELRTANFVGIFKGPSDQEPLKNLGEKGTWGLGRIQGLPKFFEHPLLSQEGVKLRTSNLARVFTGSMRTKAP